MVKSNAISALISLIKMGTEAQLEKFWKIFPELQQSGVLEGERSAKHGMAENDRKALSLTTAAKNGSRKALSDWLLGQRTLV